MLVMGQKSTIGIVGLGIMGSVMATHFLKGGHKVYLWNRTNAKAKDFESQGASACDSPAGVCANADIIFEVTADDASSRKVRWVIMEFSLKQTALKL